MYGDHENILPVRRWFIGYYHTTRNNVRTGSNRKEKFIILGYVEHYPVETTKVDQRSRQSSKSRKLTLLKENILYKKKNFVAGGL
jgi:hypothetical protein